jgi:hypothetical protein
MIYTVRNVCGPDFTWTGRRCTSVGCLCWQVSVERYGPSIARYLKVLHDAYDDARVRLSRLTTPQAHTSESLPHFQEYFQQQSGQASHAASTGSGSGSHQTKGQGESGPSGLNANAATVFAALQAGARVHRSLTLLVPPPIAFNHQPSLLFAASQFPNPASGLHQPSAPSKDRSKDATLRRDVLLSSDISLYISHQIAVEAATAPFQRYLQKLKWAFLSENGPVLERVQYLQCHPDADFSVHSLPSQIVPPGHAVRHLKHQGITQPAGSMSTQADADTAHLPAEAGSFDPAVAAKTVIESKRQAEMLFYTLDTSKLPSRCVSAESFLFFGPAVLTSNMHF